MIKYMLIGLLIGAAAGVMIPMAMWMFFEMKSPNQGVGTVFAMMIGITLPLGIGLGVIFGAIANYMNDL